MINIQKSLLVQIGFIWSILSSSVYTILIGPFGPIQSILSTKVLFCPHWLYSVHIGPILSTLVLFDPLFPLQSYLVTSIYIGSIRSSLSILVQLSPIRSILSTSILFRFGLFCPLQSYSIHLFLFRPPCSYLVHLVLLYLFGPLCSIWSNSIQSDYFGPFLSTFVQLHNWKRHIWFEST